MHLALKLWFKNSKRQFEVSELQKSLKNPIWTLNPSLKNYYAHFLSNLGFKFSDPGLKFKPEFKELLCIWRDETPIWKLKPPFEDLLRTFSFKPGFEVFKLGFEVKT